MCGSSFANWPSRCWGGVVCWGQFSWRSQVQLILLPASTLAIIYFLILMSQLQKKKNQAGKILGLFSSCSGQWSGQVYLVRSPEQRTFATCPAIHPHWVRPSQIVCYWVLELRPYIHEYHWRKHNLEGRGSIIFFHKADKDFILEPKCALNCIFEEVRSMNYNKKGRTFTSWEAFLKWVFSGPTEGVLTSSVQHAEEVYACYTKEYPWAHPKIKSRKWVLFILFVSVILSMLV